MRCVDERVCNGIAPHGSAVELITSENLPVIVARVFPQNLIHLVNPFSKQGVNDSTKRTTAQALFLKLAPISKRNICSLLDKELTYNQYDL